MSHPVVCVNYFASFPWNSATPPIPNLIINYYQGIASRLHGVIHSCIWLLNEEPTIVISLCVIMKRAVVMDEP